MPVIAQQQGAEPAAVIFDALQAARARGIDVLIADTAGRLHTQAHLMEELKKVKRVLGRLDPARAARGAAGARWRPSARTRVAQASEFNKALGVTGLVLTKLDGTAKGGVVIAIAQKLGIPIRFVGVGEQIEDFGAFDGGRVRRGAAPKLRGATAHDPLRAGVQALRRPAATRSPGCPSRSAPANWCSSPAIRGPARAAF